MRTLTLYEHFYGKSYAAMINKALGTNYSGYQKSSVPLDDFGLPGVIAWFVFMDDTLHGYEDDYVWRNLLFDEMPYYSDTGNYIREELVSKDHLKVIAKNDNEGHYPLRLAFQILEHGESRNSFRHSCRYVGAFVLSHFLREDLTIREYKKVLNNFTLKSKGDFGGNLNVKSDFTEKIPKYFTPIDKIGLSNKTLHILNGCVRNVGELLELGIDASRETSDEIRNRLYEFFKKPQPKKIEIIPTDPPLPEVFIGMKVTHKKFGTGTIVNIDAGYITVSFDCGEKQFVLATCFEQGSLTR